MKTNSNIRVAVTIALALGAIDAATAFGTVTASANSPSSSDEWVAVAASPSRESLDWAYGPDRVTAAARALDQCAQLQGASNCAVLASSAHCVALAWDVAQPLNRPHAATSTSPQAAMQTAVAAAGTYANDPQVRCTWFPHN
jgi:hypothetical protein